MLLCFFIFYLIQVCFCCSPSSGSARLTRQLQLPLLWIHISKLKYLFAVKIVIMVSLASFPGRRQASPKGRRG
jgi:hypothetical protein